MAVLCGRLQLDLGFVRCPHHPWVCPCGEPDLAASRGQAPALYLGPSYEGDANGELALHPPTQELGPQVPLVLQAEDVQHLLDFFRTLLERQAFQLKGRG